MRDPKRTLGKLLLRAGMLTAASVFAASALLMAGPSNEQALRSRVEQLYAALQRSDWAEAEKYLTEESKPIFRNQSKKAIAGYQVQSIKLESSGDEAVVVVQIPAFTGSMPGPVQIPETTHWRLIKGDWYLQLSTPQKMQLPFTAADQKPPSSPPISLHTKDLKFQSTWASVGTIHKDEVKEARFAFSNVSRRVVTVSVARTNCDCLRLKTAQKEFKPGEAGVIEFEVDPSTLSFDVHSALTLTVILETEPEHAYTQLTIAAVLSPSPAPAPR